MEHTAHIPNKQADSRGRRFVRFLLRALGRLVLVVITAAVLAVIGLATVCNLIFNGPSPSARDVLTMSMLESSGMKWCPALFIGEDTVAQIQANQAIALPDDLSDVSQIRIETDSLLSGINDEWADYPDGIRIEQIRGDTYTAHIMLVRDPSRVYTGAANEQFSLELPVKRIDQMIRRDGAVAGVNGGAFNDDGSLSPNVGRLPIGLVVSNGKVVWTQGRSYTGFAGFNEDNILVVAKTITAAQAKELKIRDGCCFGPVLIMNGNVNEEAYNTASGYNPRTCIGQRADGAVILLCIDGRQANSLGGTYADAIDILVEYGAVNACNLDGGSSSVMYYQDTEGRYGEPGELVMINNYSLLQELPRPMPTFFLVRPEGGTP